MNFPIKQISDVTLTLLFLLYPQTLIKYQLLFFEDSMASLSYCNSDKQGGKKEDLFTAIPHLDLGLILGSTFLCLPWEQNFFFCSYCYITAYIPWESLTVLDLEWRIYKFPENGKKQKKTTFPDVIFKSDTFHQHLSFLTLSLTTIKERVWKVFSKRRSENTGVLFLILQYFNHRDQKTTELKAVCTNATKTNASVCWCSWKERERFLCSTPIFLFLSFLSRKYIWPSILWSSRSERTVIPSSY